MSAARPSILLTGKIPSSVLVKLESIGEVDQFRKDGVDVMPQVRAVLAKMRVFTDALASGAHRGFTGAKITEQRQYDAKKDKNVVVSTKKSKVAVSKRYLEGVDISTY